MNLHILPDSKFTDRFYANLDELGLISGNRFIIRTNETQLSYITHDVPFAKLYSREFDKLVGDTLQYDRVYIHQFSPLMYRWVAVNRFRELNWCVWGADVYNLPGISKDFYEPLTWSGYSKNSWKKDFLYLAKLYATNIYYKKAAYRKVNNVLTWMKSEFEFVKLRLDLRSANWRFFFYENHLPYEKLDSFRDDVGEADPKKQLIFILGNSGTDTNNHLDAIQEIAATDREVDLIIPVSYGSPDYKAFLQKRISFYRNGSVRFMDTFLAFHEYVRLLLDSDGLIMNHRRPQGYGNILMMMYLEKPVFLNPRNISIPDLNDNNLRWHPLSEIGRLSSEAEHGNKEAVKRMFSHERLLTTYAEIFR